MQNLKSLKLISVLLIQIFAMRGFADICTTEEMVTLREKWNQSLHNRAKCVRENYPPDAYERPDPRDKRPTVFQLLDIDASKNERNESRTFCFELTTILRDDWINYKSAKETHLKKLADEAKRTGHSAPCRPAVAN